MYDEIPLNFQFWTYVVCAVWIFRYSYPIQNEVEIIIGFFNFSSI